MVAYNFQERFAPLVESGAKRQTIREKARCKKGDKLQLYTGMRTKKCRKLIDAVCIDVLPIQIFNSHHYIQYNHCLRSHTAKESEKFARMDGFVNYSDMYEWFRKAHKKDVFYGYLIKWKPIKE